MSSPSLSLVGHGHYTLEIRDKMLEKLRAAHLDETAYGSDAIAAAADVSELAIDHALELGHGSALEIVRGSPARRLMTSIGLVAARLRW